MTGIGTTPHSTTKDSLALQFDLGIVAFSFVELPLWGIQPTWGGGRSASTWFDGAGRLQKLKGSKKGGVMQIVAPSRNESKDGWLGRYLRFLGVWLICLLDLFFCSFANSSPCGLSI